MYCRNIVATTYTFPSTALEAEAAEYCDDWLLIPCSARLQSVNKNMSQCRWLKVVKLDTMSTTY